MVRPVNLCQSPTSTARANPVKVPTAQAAQPTYQRVNSLSAANCPIASSRRPRLAATVSTVSRSESNATRVEVAEAGWVSAGIGRREVRALEMRAKYPR